MNWNDQSIYETKVGHNYKLQSFWHVLQTETSPGHFRVESQTKPGDSYTVTKHMEECNEPEVHGACHMPECGHVCRNMYTCDCMDYRTRNTMVCKHVHAVHSKFFYCVETRNEDFSPPVVMLAENDVVPDEGQLECTVLQFWKNPSSKPTFLENCN